MITVAQAHETEIKVMREVYCETLQRMAEEDGRVVVVEADLAAPIGTVPFSRQFPERFFDCGVQESNMVGVGAGLSAAGMVPFAHTFAAFAARRCMDQVFRRVTRG